MRRLTPAGRNAMRFAGMFMVAVLTLLGASAAQADTVYLRSGVVLHGQVVQDMGSAVRFRSGDRIVALRKSEIARIEENDKTGALDKEQLRKAAEQREKELEKETGLTFEQRAAINEALRAMTSEDGDGRRRAIARLVEMNRSAPVFVYLVNWLPGMRPIFVPAVLDALTAMDLRQALPVLRSQCMHLDGYVRAHALELLGEYGNHSDEPLIARGLVDPLAQVQVAAAHALGLRESRRATPCLIAQLENPDGSVRNMSLAALRHIWRDHEQAQTNETAEQWRALWSAAHAQTPDPIAPEDLRPLAGASVHYQEEC